jgi:hypothetical protein
MIVVIGSPSVQISRIHVLLTSLFVRNLNDYYSSKDRISELVLLLCLHRFTIGEPMQELVNIIIKKTGIPVTTAQTIVNIVMDFLKKKLPAPIAKQIDGLLKGNESVKKAEGVLGNMSSLLGKKK